jgi:hypothetical protein
MNPDDYTYFRRRAVQENEAARRALCEEARTCHRKLAAGYRSRCARISMELAAPVISERPSTPASMPFAKSSGSGLAPARDAAPCEIRL